MPTIVTTINLIVGQTHDFQLVDVANGDNPISKANITMVEAPSGLFTMADAGNSGSSYTGVAAGNGTVTYEVPGYGNLVVQLIVTLGTLGLVQTS